MRAEYQEYLGNNWTQHFIVENSVCMVSLEGETAEELIDDAELKLLDTSNNSQISIEIGADVYLVRSGSKGFLYRWFDGVDYRACSRQDILDSLEKTLQV